MARIFLGVVHLPPLPSSPGHRDMVHVLESAFRDARALQKGGADGVMVENYGDMPFHKGTAQDPVPPDVPAGLALVAHMLRTELQLPVAINCLRNDGYAALGAAAIAGARWVRVNVLSGAYATDQGVIEGEAARLVAYRKQLGTTTGILADFLVKHSSPLVQVDVATGARDLAERSGAAGLVLSGARTGAPVDAQLLDTVRTAVGAFPIWIGSGLTPQNAVALWPRSSGAIVGTWIKQDGDVKKPVDADRVRTLRKVLDGLG